MGYLPLGMIVSEPFALSVIVPPPPARLANLLKSNATFPPMELMVTSHAVTIPLPSWKSPLEKALKLSTVTLPLTCTVPSELRSRLVDPLIGEPRFNATLSQIGRAHV